MFAVFFFILRHLLVAAIGDRIPSLCSDLVYLFLYLLKVVFDHDVNILVKTLAQKGKA